MRLDKTLTITKREYKARIQSKGFWIATLALPVLMGALVILPSLLIAKTKTTHQMVVLDETGRVAQVFLADQEERALEPQPIADFEIEVEAPRSDLEAQRAELDERVLDGSLDAWVWIGSDSLTESRVEYHAESVSNVLTQQVLERALSRAVGKVRLAEAGYDPEEVSGLTRHVLLDTVKVSAEGSQAERGEAGFWLAYLLFFMLYMVLVLYGQQVLTGVLEEKSSRVVEVIVSSVKPFELMLGKLLGIGLIGITQLAIWLGTLVAVTAPAVVASMSWIPEELDIPSLGFGVVAHFLGHFVLGFFLFSSLYAAIGAAFNNVQEAQQFSAVVVIFLVAPMVFFILVLNDPDSTLSMVSSLIPFFTPLLMLLRIVVKMPPLWQVALGYLLTTATIVGMVWICARIYRVGILMYGKKPTAAELWRWLRYA
jgi:ABC-2 type transport system permease protein